MIASVQNLKRLLRDMKRKVKISIQKVADILVEPFFIEQIYVCLDDKK